MSATSPAPAGAPVIPRRTWLALTVLLAGMFMALLDTTIVNVALPPIRASLNASEATLSWIISGYALAFGLALIPAGRLGDRLGHKWIYIGGLTLFTLASLSCGYAQSDLHLIVSRVVQGLACGIYVPAVTAFIQLLFEPARRGRAFAIMGSVIGVSTALGPLLGGLIIQAFGDENGWRLVFWVNLPIGVVTIIAAVLWLPSRSIAQTVGGRVDAVGLLLVTAGFVALLVPLIEGQDQGWPAWTFLSIAGSVVLIAAFGAWEVRFTRSGHTPLVPPGLFRHRDFTGGVILALVYFASFTSIFFTISLLWQAGLGHTALETGLVSLPFALGNIIGASQSNRLAKRFGRNVLVAGAAMVTAGLLATWLVLLLTEPMELSHWQFVAPLLLAGLGNGLFIAPNTAFIVATVEPREAGAASGVIGAVQRIGSATGIAVIGSVLFGTLVVKGPGPEALAEGFGHSATVAILVSVGLSALALLLVFVLPRRVERRG
ncbi:DHA2 family efflux MFS transporter permease subunit [Phytomonospora endophytica]|uniref:EmrB/QacA subfamily drug resistance transporter n=1 Tax=Phytomonospora endophytica TaxID=714109 RepID=A0A841FPP1_9ACTN|nr:DHA2 family efflux MFS transporter permease subunit [Phytomonospora endophytica]MBB6036813.1 EmrB/QacA subfamily drug resistance transporter [Phytomonospora endophytica]GIG68153.1 MFS transporter [Phytomonospora endophytica]